MRRRGHHSVTTGTEVVGSGTAWRYAVQTCGSLFRREGGAIRPSPFEPCCTGLVLTVLRSDVVCDAPSVGPSARQCPTINTQSRRRRSGSIRYQV